MGTLFTQETLVFLEENRLKNDKEWFEANRGKYNNVVLAPLISLVEELTPTLLDIDSQLLCAPKVNGTISRIWRDSRFSKDKSIFRDMMWCMFVRKKNVGLPEFFFVVSPQEFFYGCGYYSASPASMESLRRLILAGDKGFKAALAAYESQNTFRIDGDMYKRSRHPEAADNLKPWLDRKSICFLHNSTDFGLLYSEGLADRVAQGYKTLAPIYDFLLKAESSVNA